MNKGPRWIGGVAVVAMAALTGACGSAEEPVESTSTEAFIAKLAGRQIAIVELDPSREECRLDPTTLDRDTAARCAFLIPSKLPAGFLVTRDCARFSTDHAATTLLVLEGPPVDPSRGGTAWYAIVPLGKTAPTSSPIVSSSIVPADSSLHPSFLVAAAAPLLWPVLSQALTYAGTALLGLTVAGITYLGAEAVMMSGDSAVPSDRAGAVANGIDARRSRDDEPSETVGCPPPGRRPGPSEPPAFNTTWTTWQRRCSEPAPLCPQPNQGDQVRAFYIGQGYRCP